MVSETFLCVLALAVGSVRGEQPPTPAGRLTPYRDRQFERGRIHDVELDGYRYCLLDTGGTDGPPLVLLHGLGGSLYDWRHVVDALAASRRVIALDLLGAGESSMPSTADYSVFAQARRVKGLLDALDIDRATLVGNSYGGGVALAFAQDWPERLESLVLINSICYSDAAPAYLKVVQAPFAPDLVKVLPLAKPTNRFLRGCYVQPERLTDDELAHYVLELSSGARRGTVVRTLRALVPRDLTEFYARLRSIRCPALLLWGKHDDVVPLALGRRLETDLPQAELAELGASHVPHMELPAEVVTRITEFLAALPAEH